MQQWISTLLSIEAAFPSLVLTRSGSSGIISAFQHPDAKIDVANKTRTKDKSKPFLCGILHLKILRPDSIFQLHLHQIEKKMILKISRGVWLISVLGALAALLYVYAALPETVFLSRAELSVNSVSRELFFYSVLAVLTLFNSLVFAVGTIYNQDYALRGWFNGLIVTFNLFIIVALFFVNSSNSNEKFDFSRIGVTIYSSVALMAVWALSWPLILLFRKFSTKA